MSRRLGLYQHEKVNSAGRFRYAHILRQFENVKEHGNEDSDEPLCTAINILRKYGYKFLETLFLNYSCSLDW